MQSDRDAIAALTGAFFDTFTMRGGIPEHIDSLYDLFVPGAVIVKNVDGAGEVVDVAGFVEPRRAILSGGSMENFREWETAERTEICGHVAHRLSGYQKFWSMSGKAYGGTGVKALQFVRVADGWKISALAWDDFLVIRPLEVADVASIREIDAACFDAGDQYDDAMYQTMRDSQESIVAVEGGAVVGYAYVQRNVWEAELHVRSLAVDPRHQRRGYGQALMRTVIEASPGCVDLLVAPSNTHAVGFYTRLGFVPAEVCESVPGRKRMTTAPGQSRQSDRPENLGTPVPTHRRSS